MRPASFAAGRNAGREGLPWTGAGWTCGFMPPPGSGDGWARWRRGMG